MKNSLAREIYEVAHLTGTFTLRSGQISNEYFDNTYLSRVQQYYLK